jgi:hypothetical protein
MAFATVSPVVVEKVTIAVPAALEKLTVSEPPVTGVKEPTATL